MNFFPLQIDPRNNFLFDIIPNDIPYFFSELDFEYGFDWTSIVKNFPKEYNVGKDLKKKIDPTKSGAGEKIQKLLEPFKSYSEWESFYFKVTEFVIDYDSNHGYQNSKSVGISLTSQIAVTYGLNEYGNTQVQMMKELGRGKTNVPMVSTDGMNLYISGEYNVYLHTDWGDSISMITDIFFKFILIDQQYSYLFDNVAMIDYSDLSSENKQLYNKLKKLNTNNEEDFVQFLVLLDTLDDEELNGAFLQILSEEFDDLQEGTFFYNPKYINDFFEINRTLCVQAKTFLLMDE